MMAIESRGMRNQTDDDAQRMALLSELMFSPRVREDRPLPHWELEFTKVLELANKHHVVMRALPRLEAAAADRGDGQLQSRCQAAVEQEKKRISNAVEWLDAIVQAMQNSGCPVCVIKSLDHWPDLGSDLDLYTSGTPERVCQVMREKLQAKEEPRSWGDRLA